MESAKHEMKDVNLLYCIRDLFFLYIKDSDQINISHCLCRYANETFKFQQF